MIWLPKRATLAQREFWKFIDSKIDWISQFNRRRVPEYRGDAHYDSRGYLERYPEIYNVGHRGFWSEGRFIPAIAGGVWVPPIGVPDPGWGIDTPTMPALPSPWTSDTNGFYYVKQGGGKSPNGTGNGFPGGVLANQCGSIPNPIPPGKVVVIDNSVPFSMPVNIQGAGTVNSPCFMVGSSLSTTNRAQLNGVDRNIFGTYFVLEYLHFHAPSNGPCVWFGNGTIDHMSCRHCEGTGILSADNNLFTMAGGTCTNWIWYDGNVHDNGDWQWSGQADIDAQGFQIQSNRSNIWFLDSAFTHLGGQAVTGGNQEQAGVDTTEHHVYVGRCTATQNLAGGFAFKGATDHIVSQCTSTGHRSNPVSQAGPCQGVGFQYNVMRYWFIYNHCYDIEDDGLEMFETGTTCVDVYAIGNVVHSCGARGMELQRPASSGPPPSIVNNTIVNCPTGIGYENGATILYENNIIDNCSNFHMEDTSGSGSGGSTIRNNIFGPGGQPFRVQYNGTSYTTLAAFNTAIGGNGSNNINADPTYVDGTNSNHALRNFKLVVGSRGIDEGKPTEPACYARFQSLYGLDIRQDFDSLVRPQGGTWDIGAFEFSTGVDTTPPTISIVNPAGTTYITNQNPFTILSGVSADDVAVTSVTWTNDRGGSGTATGTTAWTVPSITLQTGANVLTVTAHDAAGNTASDSVTVTLDQIAPVIAINDPTTGSSVSTSSSPLPTLGGTASDANGIVSVSWSNDRGGSGIATGTTTWSVSSIVLQPGVNILTATALDSAGNTASAFLTVMYTPSQAPPPARPFLS